MKLKMSKAQWEQMGKEAGWMTGAQSDPVVIAEPVEGALDKRGQPLVSYVLNTSALAKLVSEVGGGYVMDNPQDDVVKNMVMNPEDRDHRYDRGFGDDDWVISVNFYFGSLAYGGEYEPEHLIRLKKAIEQLPGVENVWVYEGQGRIDFKGPVSF